MEIRVLAIGVEENTRVCDWPCALCGERFHLTPKQPVLYGWPVDGERAICGACFQALQTGGTAALVAQLGRAADDMLKNGKRLRKEGKRLGALAADLEKIGIRFEEVKISLPDDPTAELAELGRQHAAQDAKPVQDAGTMARIEKRLQELTAEIGSDALMAFHSGYRAWWKESAENSGCETEYSGTEAADRPADPQTIQNRLMVELQTAQAKLAEVATEERRLRGQTATLETLIAAVETHPDYIPY